MAEEDVPQGSTSEPKSASDDRAGSARVGDTDSPGRSRARGATRSPPVNAIQATRRQRRVRSGTAETDDPAPAPHVEAADTAIAQGASSPSANTKRADSDPWTVPESIRDRFIQDGNRFFFPDGAPAFKDLGRRLTTSSENTQVVHSLIQIAHSRGWSEVTVTGTERFRQEAWRQARMAGVAVRGYRPTDVEQAQLIRAMARHLSGRSSGATDAISADASSSAAPSAGNPVAAPIPQVVPEARPRGSTERIAGKLIEHGRDSYRHDPQEEMSYFVSVQTREGRREIWGKDLERAMTKSLTQPQVGDEVVLQKTGRDAVTVTRQERDGAGQLRPKEIDTHRNRWVLERSSFFEERAKAASVVRDASIEPPAAVKESPQLAGTYLSLKAAELGSRSLREAEDRRRFLAAVRAALADEIERGEPLQPVRLRERPATRTPRSREERGMGRAAART